MIVSAGLPIEYWVNIEEKTLDKSKVIVSGRQAIEYWSNIEEKMLDKGKVIVSGRLVGGTM